jgi:hypothetical protein
MQDRKRMTKNDDDGEIFQMRTTIDKQQSRWRPLLTGDDTPPTVELTSSSVARKRKRDTDAAAIGKTTEQRLRLCRRDDFEGNGENMDQAVHRIPNNDNSAEVEGSRSSLAEAPDENFQLVVENKERETTEVANTDPRLGVWVCTTSMSCRQEELSILFQWKFVADNDPWLKMYQRLKAFKIKCNHTRVPTGYKADPQLGNWVSNQRRICKDKDRIDLLNEIGFEWNARVSDWELMYHRLLMHKKEHGTECVPAIYKADPQLGNWVSNQRQYCKDKYRIDLLNDIGFEWNARVSDWELMYHRLSEYKKKYGNTCVPKSYKADIKLAGWVRRQRRSCKDKYRVDLLKDIGFVWDARGRNQYS